MTTGNAVMVQPPGHGTAPLHTPCSVLAVCPFLTLAPCALTEIQSDPAIHANVGSLGSGGEGGGGDADDNATARHRARDER
jgi:hypothetical protein